MKPLKLSYQHAKKNISKGTLYYPLKKRFGNEIIPKIKNILSTLTFMFNKKLKSTELI